jgi:uncharacterized membrane protein YhfC
MVISISATIMFICIIFLTLVLHALKQKRKTTLLLFYGLFAAILLVTFLIVQTDIIVAAFQFSVTLSLMLTLLFITTASVKAGQNKPIHKS